MAVSSILVNTSLINTKLGDFVNLVVRLVLTMWINSCLSQALFFFPLSSYKGQTREAKETEPGNEVAPSQPFLISSRNATLELL